jgi:ATP-dependent DNA helicase RecG
MLPESKTIEYKREFTDDIKKTVIALANTDGGKIFIGVEDYGSVLGVAQPDAVTLQVNNAIRDAIRPDVTLFTETSLMLLEEKPVVVISIQRGTARPYYLSGNGIRPEGVFVRQGSSTVPATETAILNMIKETSGDSYETARSLNQQLTFQETNAYFKRKDVGFEKSHKRTLGLIGDDGMYTNLALLLSDQCAHNIKLAVFEGDRKSIFKERREFSGSLLRQLEEVYAYLDRFNRTKAEFKVLDRIDIRDYAHEVIREALLNAIVHRDYSFSSSALISIFDDRIEFTTIGGLVKGITLNDIMLGVSVLRNQHLANIFYRLNLIEAYGTGIPKIMGAYEGYKVKPKIEVSDNAFKITLPNINSLPSSLSIDTSDLLGEREKQVMRLLDENEFIQRKDVELALNISQQTAVLLLRKMIENGLVKKVGSGKLVKYIRGR